MTTIFYAVGGEGMGHATRSEAVIRYLLLNGYDIVVFSYDRALDYLRGIFNANKGVLEIVEITGINFVYEKNEFRLGRTIIRESKKVPSFVIMNASIFLDRILKYSPRLIITDFEPVSNSIAKVLGIPSICIDNINFIAKCQLDKKLKHLATRKFTEYILKFNGDFNFITTVFDAPLKEEYRHNTFLVAPIIRDCFKDAKTTEKDFILVYQTSKSYSRLIDVLKQSDENYIIYGFNKSYSDKNLTFKKQSRNGFAKDLASCKAFITNGGFTSISEAAMLKKPIYSIPIKHHAEQEINGYYIAKLGFGVNSRGISRNSLKKFLGNLNAYRKNLSKIKYDGNELFMLLDQKLPCMIGSYRAPASFRMAAKIKKGYSTFIKGMLYNMDLSNHAEKFISSKPYKDTKKYFNRAQKSFVKAIEDSKTIFDK
jgi:uncharacterized protein (TIGR00661 family)